jgi:hypothetical protein
MKIERDFPLISCDKTWQSPPGINEATGSRSLVFHPDDAIPFLEAHAYFHEQGRPQAYTVARLTVDGQRMIVIGSADAEKPFGGAEETLFLQLVAARQIRCGLSNRMRLDDPNLEDALRDNLEAFRTELYGPKLKAPGKELVNACN